MRIYNSIIKLGKYLFVIFGFFLFSSYTINNKNNSLIGKWQYLDCTIKNTAVNGTIQFFKDSSFIFKGKVNQDFPTKPFSCKHKYSINGNKLSCKTTEFSPFENPPIADYFFIHNDTLYFSNQPMLEVMNDWSGSYRKTNWIYQLKRIK